MQHHLNPSGIEISRVCRAGVSCSIAGSRSGIRVWARQLGRPGCSLGAGVRRKITSTARIGSPSCRMAPSQTWM